MCLGVVGFRRLARLSLHSIALPTKFFSTSDRPTLAALPYLTIWYRCALAFLFRFLHRLWHRCNFVGVFIYFGGVVLTRSVFINLLFYPLRVRFRGDFWLQGVALQNIFLALSVVFLSIALLSGFSLAGFVSSLVLGTTLGTVGLVRRS